MILPFRCDPLPSAHKNRTGSLSCPSPSWESLPLNILMRYSEKRTPFLDFRPRSHPHETSMPGSEKNGKDADVSMLSINMRKDSNLTAVLLTVTLLPCAGYAADGSLANFKSDGEAPVFSDVSPDDWFAPYVRAVSEVGLMIGDGEGRFDPEGDVTLAEVYAVAARIHAIYTTGSKAAADEYENDADKPWFYGYVKYCMDKGIMNGEPGDVTQPAFRRIS